MTKPCPKCHGKKLRTCGACKKAVLACKYCKGSGVVLSVKNTGTKQFKWIYENYPKIKNWTAVNVFTHMRNLGLYSKKSNEHDCVMSVLNYMDMVKKHGN